MKKVILAPDSFKGTMSAVRVCQIMADAVHARFPSAQAVSLPVADGGEGTVDCLLGALGGRRVTLSVTGPLGGKIPSFYGLLPDGKTAVVETAAAAGLTLVSGREDPLKASTFGVGELIRAAVGDGCEKLILGLGGSCTNDGGAGMAAALGVRFLDREGRPFVPAGGTLGQIDKIDRSGLEPKLRGVAVEAMCDVDNPLCGPEGASCIFGPQKGADEPAVRLLDSGLAHFAGLLRRDLGADLEAMPGAGAAGGLGAGAVAFLGAALKPGIGLVLDTVGFDQKARDADVIFTGEGRLDGQSLRGKVVAGVAARGKSLGVPVVAVAGDLGGGIDRLYDRGLTAAVSINRVAVDFAHARIRCESDLALTMDGVLRLIAAGIQPEEACPDGS